MVQPEIVSIVNNSVWDMTEITMKQTIGRLDFTKWFDDMAVKTTSTIKNETWILQDHPVSEKIIASKIGLRSAN